MSSQIGLDFSCVCVSMCVCVWSGVHVYCIVFSTVVCQKKGTTFWVLFHKNCRNSSNTHRKRVKICVVSDLMFFLRAGMKNDMTRDPYS